MKEEQIITHKGKKYKVIEVIEEDYKKLTLKGKEYRIYKWENKEIGKFNYPKGFRLIEHSEFIELFDNQLIDYPKAGWEYYFTKHYSKRKQKENILSGCYLIRGSYLSSIDSSLSNSNDSGRVVVVEEKK